MAQDGKEDLEASKEGSWKNGVAADADIECTISRFIEAMAWITMTGENRHFVPEVLKTDGPINNQTLSTTYTKIWMEKDNALGPRHASC